MTYKTGTIGEFMVRRGGEIGIVSIDDLVELADEGQKTSLAKAEVAGLQQGMDENARSGSRQAQDEDGEAPHC